MTLLRKHRIAGFLLVILSIVAFSIAELDFTLLFTAVVLAVVSWYVTEGPRGRTLPNWATNALTLALFAYSVYGFALDGAAENAMGSLGRFLLWLLVLKLFAARVEREDRQRFMLSTMLVVAGCLESVDFAFGMLVFVYVGLAAWTAMLWRLAKGAETARAARASHPDVAVPLEVGAGRRAAAQFRGLAAASVAGIFAAGIVAFAIFPRFADIELDGSAFAGRVTGFNDEIDLRTSDRILESRRELFTVQWIGTDGSPEQSARPLLLRGAVLDTYDTVAQRWRARRTQAAVTTIRTLPEGKLTDLTRGRGSGGRASYRARIEMRSLASDVLFAPYAPTAIATGEATTVALDPRTLLLRDVSIERGARSWSYEVVVQPQPDAETLEGLASSPRRRSGDRWLDLPIPDFEPIAREVLADAGRTANLPAELGENPTDEERWTRNRELARAIAGWMRNNFSYTTDLSSNPRVPGEDPIVSFLTRYRSGHCEYFASALCAVLRSLGIESRIVTGFIALEYDARGNYYVVRESNAHAWVEVRSGEFAWTAVDATPEESLVEIQERNRSFADRFRWIYSRLEFLWNSSVVSYDSSSQQDIADRVQTGWREATSARIEAVIAWMRAVATSLSLGRAGGAWFAVIGIGLGTAGLAALIALVRGRRDRAMLGIERIGAAELSRLRRDAAFYLEALRLLAKAGYERPAHMTPRDFAGRLASEHRAIGAAFGPIAEEFYKVRYGGLEPSGREANAHLSMVLALREAIRRNPRARRVD
ncbi:MAG: Protein-glutamine gamma-glutamyltransferase [Planctomycetota bacterium]